MSAYNSEQLSALLTVREYLRGAGREKRGELERLAGDYLGFRQRVRDFSGTHFDDPCRKKCYESKKSLCCSKEGIIAYFADVFVNALFSEDSELDLVALALREPRGDDRCVFLGNRGCVFRIKPIVCEMFVCDEVKDAALGAAPDAREALDALAKERKRFTWPDRPVFFDQVEALFIEEGHDSPLMYLHKSPGLLMVKERAGLIEARPRKRRRRRS